VNAVIEERAERVALLGAGRGSAELLDLLEDAAKPSSIVVLDDLHPSGPTEVKGRPVVGRLEAAHKFFGEGYRLALGIANSRQLGIRNDLAARLGLPEEAWLTYAHPAATVSADSSLGPGTLVYPGARIAVGARLGRLSLIYYNAVVHHDCLLGDGAVLCAGALLAGGVVVGEGSYLGIGSVVRDGVRIGRRALVGMGAVVLSDVPDGARVAGVPAKALLS
jgi:sugar O-acyltransferase (sialic acid O-acetyltransferase NeuD family)